MPGHLQVYFEGLIVNYSSHNHGQKLFLRFSLIDDSQGEETEICFTDGATFETITKRGIESMLLLAYNMLLFRTNSQVEKGW